MHHGYVLDIIRVGDAGLKCCLTIVETTLKNPTCAGCGSSTDVTLIPPHKFSVTTGFGYYNGCDGAGADCTYQGCPTAFYHPDDTWVQVPCQVDNVSSCVGCTIYKLG